MKYLNFSEDFTEKILNGTKTATLRLGVKDYRPGQEVIIKTGSRELSMAVIKEVNFKKFSEIDEEDVRRDGFKDKEELKKALEQFYGEFEEDALFTQIVFTLHEES